MMADAIDESISELFSPGVLEEFHNALLRQYDITRDEMPYRLESAIKLLTNVFGLKATDTIGRVILRRLYRKFDLQFDESTAQPSTNALKLQRKDSRRSAIWINRPT